VDISKYVLAATVLLATATPSFAIKFWCQAPEIDAAVGPSALAILAAAGFIAYKRSRA